MRVSAIPIILFLLAVILVFLYFWAVAQVRNSGAQLQKKLDQPVTYDTIVPGTAGAIESNAEFLPYDAIQPGQTITRTFASGAAVRFVLPQTPSANQEEYSNAERRGLTIRSDDYTVNVVHATDLKNSSNFCVAQLLETTIKQTTGTMTALPAIDPVTLQFEGTRNGVPFVLTRRCILGTPADAWVIDITIDKDIFDATYKDLVPKILDSFDHTEQPKLLGK